MRNKLALILSLAFAFSASAQNMKTFAPTPKKDNSFQKGFYIGSEYMNLTDMRVTVRGTSEYGNFNDRYEGGTHLGVAGIRLGYAQTPEKGFGFEAGARLLESLNRSEYGDTKLQMIVPEGNLTGAVNRYFLGYIGLNVAVWTGSTEASKYKPGVGGQIGLGARFSKHFALNAGSTLMNQTLSSTSEFGNSKFDAEILVSGFTANLTYTF